MLWYLHRVYTHTHTHTLLSPLRPPTVRRLKFRVVVQKRPVRVFSRKKQSQDNLEARQAPFLSSTFLSSYWERSTMVPWINKHPWAFLNSLRAAVTTASMLPGLIDPLIHHAKQGAPTLTHQDKSQKAILDCWELQLQLKLQARR